MANKDSEIKTTCLYQALQTVVGATPPVFMQNTADINLLTDQQVEELYQWCDKASQLPWVGSWALIEAAHSLVANAALRNKVDDLGFPRLPDQV